MRLQKKAKQIASERAHESDEQQPQQRKVEALGLHQKLLQRVGSSVSSENHGFIVCWLNWLDRETFILCQQKFIVEWKILYIKTYLSLL